MGSFSRNCLSARSGLIVLDCSRWPRLRSLIGIPFIITPDIYLSDFPDITGLDDLDSLMEYLGGVVSDSHLGNHPVLLGQLGCQAYLIDVMSK